MTALFRWSSGKGPKMGSRGYRKLRRWNYGFGSVSDRLGVRGYIQEEEVRRWSNRGPTRVGGAPPQGAPPASWAPRCSSDVLLPPIYTHVPPNDQNRSQKPNYTAATFCIPEIPSWGLFRSSAGGGIHHGGLLHQHHSPSDEL